MKWSYRSVKKAIQKLRKGRDITSSELVIINRHHRKEFYLSKWARISTSMACNVAQLAAVVSQPIPRESEPISERMIRSLKSLEIAMNASEQMARIASEVFEPNKKRAYVELYGEKKRTVGNYGFCSDIRTPLPKFECGTLPAQETLEFVVHPFKMPMGWKDNLKGLTIEDFNGPQP